MSFLKSLTRNKPGVPGFLGAVQRSVGYLQGGYKDATIHSRVQLFNTNTQVGTIVFDTGYQRYYKAGISGNFAGYFNISDTVAYNKFNYITASAAVSFTTTKFPNVSVSDFNIYSVAWILCSANASWAGNTYVDDWVQLNLSTETPVSNGNISSGPQITTRQGMSSGIGGFFFDYNKQDITAFNFGTKVANVGITSSLLNSTYQVACGMSVSNTLGYFVGYMPNNVKVNISGSTILSCSLSTSFTYNFGESHSLTTATSGYMMAGFVDTTGRYGLSQHGLCQKITFANESITTMADLVLPQSSGQMMQGF